MRRFQIYVKRKARLKTRGVTESRLPFAFGCLDRDTTRIKLTALNLLAAKTARTPLDIHHSGIVPPRTPRLT
jgi:hypothetical protein